MKAMRQRAMAYRNPLFESMSNDDESDAMDAEQLQLLSELSSRICLVRSLWKLERRLNHPKALGREWRNVESQDKEEYSRAKWLEDMAKIKAILKDTSEKEFRDLFRSLSLRLEDVTSEFAGDDRFVRRDWYYDRTAWRSDLTNCCVTESQLYFAMHRFQHDALDWIAIGDVLPDMDRRDFLRGAKLNERATIPDLGTHVVFFSEGYKETLLRDAGVNMLRAFPSICKFVGQPHDGRIVQVPKKTAQWLRVAAAHHFDDAVRGVRVRSYYSLLSSNITNT